MNEYESFAKASESEAARKAKLAATMFPPTAEEAAAFNLDRCMRCVPHDEVGRACVVLCRTTPGP